MSHSDHPNLHRLVARMRNRLWLERALLLIDWGVICAAGLLVAAAMIHIFFAALPWRYGMGLAVVPLFVAVLVSALFRRPSPATAALASDQRFECREIFISALEQTSVAPDERLGNPSKPCTLPY